MRKVIMPMSVLVAVLATGHPQRQYRPSFPEGGFVPDARTAVGVGQAVLIPIYGEKEIHVERRFKANRHGDVWTVEGILHCGKHPGTACPDGTAVVKISKTSGQILEGGSVSDTKTAARIGEAVLIARYGKKIIMDERPFTATLEGEEWTVGGTLHCGGPPGTMCVGGVAVVKISKTSGQILDMGHYK